MMKILVVKTSSLGDIIHTFPAIKLLRTLHPYAKIDWVVEKPFAELVESHPSINRVLCIDTKSWRKAWLSKNSRHQIFAFRKTLREQRYDMVFDFQGNVKSGLITSQSRSPLKIGFGWKTVAERPNFFMTNRHYNPPVGLNIRNELLFIVQRTFAMKEGLENWLEERISLKISEEQRLIVNHFLKKVNEQGGPKIMVCPGSIWRNKQLHPNTLSDFLQKIRKQLNCVYLLTWGNEGERELANQLSRENPSSIVLDRLSLPVLQNLMQQVESVIAMDSLPLHLAATTSTPTFSVFGASSSKKYRPAGKQHFALQGICPYGHTFEKRCPLLRSCPTGECIRGFSGDQLYEAFIAWYHRRDEG